MFVWIVVICIAVCKAVSMLPATTVEDVSPCENGWIYFGEEYCYKLHRVSLDWRSASDSCSSMGGHLASIHSKEQNDRFKNASKETGIEHLWTGLHDSDLDRKFVWDDGTDVQYTNWGSREPNGDFNSGDCVLISFTALREGMWYVFPCYLSYPYYCQKKTTTVIRSTRMYNRPVATTAITSVGVDNTPVAASVTTSMELNNISVPTAKTTSKESGDSDCFISVTTYTITVIAIVILALIGGMCYYKRFWLEKKRLKVATVFFRRNKVVNDPSMDFIIEQKGTR